MARAPKGRPRLGGNGRHVQQYKLNSESVEKKLCVLDTLADTGNIKATITHFYPSLSDTAYNSKRTQIYRWKRDEVKLRAAATVRHGRHKKVRSVGVGALLSSELEEEIAQWVNTMRKDGVPVSVLMLSEQAKERASAAGIDLFSASSCWVDGFKARHRLSMRSPTRQGQIRPEDIDAVARAFATEVHNRMAQLGVSRVYNADQTAVFFEYIPTKTLNAKGAKTVWIKCAGASKDRATVMLLGSSDGARYSPFVIFKTQPSTKPEMRAENAAVRRGFGKRVWAEVKQLSQSTGLEIFGNAKGWWNSGLSVKFLKFHFGEREDPDRPVLLLWDDFGGHWTKEVREYAASIQVILMKVPPHATSVCQPADVAWNYPFKSRLRRHWLEHLKMQVTRKPRPKPFKLVPPGRPIVAEWIQQSWGDLSATTIANGYKKCEILPTDECIASASLVEMLKGLSLLNTSDSVTTDSDFDRVVNGEQ